MLVLPTLLGILAFFTYSYIGPNFSKLLSTLLGLSMASLGLLMLLVYNLVPWIVLPTLQLLLTRVFFKWTPSHKFYENLSGIVIVGLVLSVYTTWKQLLIKEDIVELLIVHIISAFGFIAFMIRSLRK